MELKGFEEAKAIASLCLICNTSYMVVRMRANRAHRDNRRSHHALSVARFSKCGKCGAMHRSHAICTNCGYYKGCMVLDVTTKASRKDAKTKSGKN